MSYKAAASLRECIELATIRNMSPEDINELLTKQKLQIESLKSEVDDLKKAVHKIKNGEE